MIKLTHLKPLQQNSLQRQLEQVGHSVITDMIHSIIFILSLFLLFVLKYVPNWKWTATWSAGHALARHFHGKLVAAEWRLWDLWMTETNELTLQLSQKYPDLTPLPDGEKGDLVVWMPEIHMNESVTFYVMPIQRSVLSFVWRIPPACFRANVWLRCASLPVIPEPVRELIKNLFVLYIRQAVGVGEENQAQQ
jgi:hypothetical protein